MVVWVFLMVVGAQGYLHCRKSNAGLLHVEYALQLFEHLSSKALVIALF